MALNPPPIQDKIVNPELMTPQTWILWFNSVYRVFNAFSDTQETGSDGILDGGRRTTGVGRLIGGRRV